MEQNVDILVLNRNLGEVTNKLIENLKDLDTVKLFGVIDAGSRHEEISKFTVVRDDSSFALENGLRPNKGFHLGLEWWEEQESESQWVLLLPNDSEISNWQPKNLFNIIEFQSTISAVIPLSPGNPYISILPENRVALGWNFHEGPIILSSDFIRERLSQQKYIFDPENFRGYLSFIELALQIYSNNQGIVGTDLISFSENQTHILKNSQLIGTEPYSDNLRLLVDEGERWLLKKHGITDRWSLELQTRLVFEEFLRVNPDLAISKLV